ncbi:MAG TPA: MgtC/SapB family protein, partial [Aquifex sp.]|nr:MgtC/SapB family protein [Aquifex sp.]
MEGNPLDLSKLKSLASSPEVKFLLSLLVGFLIGLEREIRGKLGQDVFAGIRTFPLIAG